MYRLGIDIGGTFTDLVLLDERTGELTREKVLTQQSDPAEAVVEGVQALLAGSGVSPGQITNAIHGTTLVSNTIIERKGAPTGLITTRGFRDALEIGREGRYDLYDLFLELPRPLVPRHLRLEVTERLDPLGEVLLPLDEGDVQKAVEHLRQEGVKAVAVCLLHAFRNPDHERRIKARIAETCPDVAISLSSEVVPEIREYERTSTTTANAYVQPVVSRYLSLLEGRLSDLGLGGRLYVILSDGGLATCQTASAFPVRLVESGPAGGVLAGLHYGQKSGAGGILTFDMGGTTAKTALIDGGEPRVVSQTEVARIYRFKKGSGLPLKVPVVEMIEIGAGGGSIARIDGMGLLKVGPDSAGAHPGPACYGFGGDAPTVTDADLVLGYLNPDYFLGGRMGLDVSRAREAILQGVAKPLNVSLDRAAWGIHQIVNEGMAGAARIHAVERGRDIRAYTLVATGGAGPVHACGVAERLNIRRVVFPVGAGVASSFGFLLAPVAFDFVHTHMGRLAELRIEEIASLYRGMEETGAATLREAGVPPDQVRFLRTADLRYAGQGSEVTCPIPPGDLPADFEAAFRAAFEDAYRRLYGRTCPGVPVEAVNWRLRATGPRPEVRALSAPPASGPALKDRRNVCFREAEGYVPCPVYNRYALGSGFELRGPAIIEERESTVVLPPSWSARVDDDGSLVAERI